MTTQSKVEKNRLEFLPGIAEQLGWYIYALRDPRDRTVFYVGKGIGNRAYEHARAAKSAGDNVVKPKPTLIRDIHSSGHEVIVEIVRRDLPDEKTAYEVEAAVIDALQHAGRSNLTSQVAGHGHSSRGWSSLEALRHLEAEPVEIPESLQPCVLIRPRQKYRYSMSIEDMWEATRGGWTFKRRPYKFAFCVHDAIVRGVWRVTDWDPDEERWGAGRRGLEGEPALDLWDEYVGRHVGSYLPRRGGQLPYTVLINASHPTVPLRG